MHRRVMMCMDVKWCTEIMPSTMNIFVYSLVFPRPGFKPGIPVAYHMGSSRLVPHHSRLDIKLGTKHRVVGTSVGVRPCVHYSVV